MKKFSLFIFFFAFVFNVNAQDTFIKKGVGKEKANKQVYSDDVVLKFKKQLVGGFKLNNDGYGGFIEFGKYSSTSRCLLYQFEISERKHAKEEKLQNNYMPTSPLIYGKLNFFYPVRLGVQKFILLGNKGPKNGVCISGNIGGGISLGLLRPYMIQINKGNNTYAFVNYNSADSIYYLDDQQAQYIVGGPSFAEGWNNLKLVPGLYFKPSLRFDYGKYNDVVSGLEVGINAEAYSKKIPQMIRIKQHEYFLSIYAAILFGKRM